MKGALYHGEQRHYALNAVSRLGGLPGGRPAARERGRNRVGGSGRFGDLCDEEPRAAADRRAEVEGVRHGPWDGRHPRGIKGEKRVGRGGRGGRGLPSRRIAADALHGMEGGTKPLRTIMGAQTPN